jgi:hypothetical protein
MFADHLMEIVRTRVHKPAAIAEAAARRRPGAIGGRLVLVAADHPARGALRAGSRPLAMADRADLLERLCVALSRPGVDGVLGTADILEDLLLLGALEGKVVIGSMNRGGLAGTVFEMDDRFTGYSAGAIAAMGFDGGKMLTRIALGDPATPAALAGTTRAVNELNDRQLIAMVEPFLSVWTDGRIRNDLSTDAVVKSITIASGLGRRTAYTWLKLPVVPDMERVLASSTLPALLLGGEVTDPEAAFASWGKALKQPTAQGLVVGRSLLYPSNGDVAGAVDKAVSLL